ncbi:hypothetical protein HPDFL43_16441 [Hoeflea phototrophica DFL-43]|uniref:Invasion protein B, involved in pathogenesis n=1 Tax=Hoeflea phototrophica (strain DSM 17068 / NCIMB 14078 / DFL-43) TaxID=411684 RepID=A9D7I0_HOEPD|nr:hypothetical protein [Hoeflea phototrophica]EDQ33082.2 hypothetical protein HPDFL43_16441 [Hoeflea phototrophica DFL-43]
MTFVLSKLIKSAIATSAAGLIVSANMMAPSQALSLVAPPGWQVSGEGTDVKAYYCQNNSCAGLELICTGYGVPAIMRATGLARSVHLPGGTELTIEVDNVPYSFATTMGFVEGNGIVPQFQLKGSEPIVEALSSGHEARLTMNEREAFISLEGSRKALQTFGRECGWDGFQSFPSVHEQRAANLAQAASLPNGSRLSPYQYGTPTEQVLQCADYPPLNGQVVRLNQQFANSGDVMIQFPDFEDGSRSFSPPLMSSMTPFGDTFTDREALQGGYVSDWEIVINELGDGSTVWDMMVPDYGSISCQTRRL